LKLFAEGTSISATVRDTGFRLGLQGLAAECDRVELTVLGDLSQPGPYPVGEKEYQRAATFTVPAKTENLSDLGCFDIGSPPGFSQPLSAFPVTIRGLMRYPAQTAGADQPVSQGLDSYPLVVLAHGNHRSLLPGGARVESFRGLEYLARHFASYGYVAVSVDLEDMNLNLPAGTTQRFPAILQRGLVILEHIQEMATLNGSDPRLQGHIDLGQIALLGHSRGGEAVVSAQRTNVDETRGRQVQAVVSIAPTDFLGIVHDSTPYLAIYGSADGDVSGGQALRLYDRARPLKSAIFAYGAIHNRFSTNPDWLAHLDSGDSRRLSETDHLNIARGYSLGFLEMVLRNQRDHSGLFARNERPAAVAAGVEIHHQFQHPTRLTVDNFEQGAALNRAQPLPPQLATRAQTNSLGGAVTGGGLAVPGGGFTNARTEASLRRIDPGSFFHDTVGGLIAWNSAGGTYTTALGGRDVSAFEVLSLRVCQRFDSPRNFNPPDPPAPAPPAPGAPMDLFVRLVDTGGQAATVRIGTVALIPYPYKRSDTSTLTKSVLKTIRLPLAAFTAANPGLSLTAIATLVLELRPNATGEIAVDDLELSI
jgi:hypothetical protein